MIDRWIDRWIDFICIFLVFSHHLERLCCTNLVFNTAVDCQFLPSYLLKQGCVYCIVLSAVHNRIRSRVLLHIFIYNIGSNSQVFGQWHSLGNLASAYQRNEAINTV